MGRLATTKVTRGDYRDDLARDDSASAISLHSNLVIDEEEDETDLPPYSDNPEVAPLVDPRSYNAPPPLEDAVVEEGKDVDLKGTSLTRISNVLTSDPIALKRYIQRQANEDLRSHICITGTHTEKHRRDNKTETKTVTDFEFYIDASDTITKLWSSLNVVPNNRKTYRGGRIKRKDERFRADVEATHETQSLDEWCHLFCASSSKLKTFTMRRVITDRNEKEITANIVQIVRGARYRGHIQVTFPTHNRKVIVVSPHPLNYLRNNAYVYWACIILQLWLITWPVLWLMTKRWDILEVTFPFKQVDKHTGCIKYVSESEIAWSQKWAYTIMQSCIRRIQGMSQVSYINAQQDSADKAQRARDVQQNIQSQGGFVGGALSLVRGGLAIATEYNENRDWGFDDS